MSAAPAALRFTEPTGPETGEVLVLGHSLGTSAALWNDALPYLEDRLRVLRWELPGHGEAAPARAAYRVGDLTDALVAALDRRGIERIHYAGVSISGCVGLDLCLRHAERVSTVTVISSGARVDDPQLMRDRAATARAEGVAIFVDQFRTRWFAPTTSPATADRILGILKMTDPESYGLAAEALADFDVWDLVPRIASPLLAIGGELDRSVPVQRSVELATRAQRGIAASIPDAAHSLVAERPDVLSKTLLDFVEQTRDW